VAFEVSETSLLGQWSILGVTDKLLRTISWVSRTRGEVTGTDTPEIGDANLDELLSIWTEMPGGGEGIHSCDSLSIYGALASEPARWVWKVKGRVKFSQQIGERESSLPLARCLCMSRAIESPTRCLESNKRTDGETWSRSPSSFPIADSCFSSFRQTSSFPAPN
jgi:hypothetical protein